MISNGSGDDRGEVRRAEFTSTHWSVVLAAGQQESPQAQEALEKLCRTYWYPLYAYLRRQGHGPEDAQDLTQGFFARLLQKNSIAAADPAKGRFRSYLLGALKYFLADATARSEAKKRGGGHTFLSWEQDGAEARFGRELVDALSPDKLFDRRWALTLLEQAAGRLRNEFQLAGQVALFEPLKPYVLGERDAPPYAETARRLDLSESAVKSAIFRLRRRYHELVREEVAQTLENPNELEEELRHLMAVFSAPPATFSPRCPSTE